MAEDGVTSRSGFQTFFQTFSKDFFQTFPNSLEKNSLEFFFFENNGSAPGPF
jgi:hypothetical protein